LCFDGYIHSIIVHAQRNGPKHYYDRLLPQQANSELEDHPLYADPVFVLNLRTRHVVLTQNTINMERTYGDTERGRRLTSFAGTAANYQHCNAFVQRLLTFPEHCDSQNVPAYGRVLCDRAAVLRKGAAQHRRVQREVQQSGTGRWC
jgi:hypothetical protein